jgi:hypothetical protein
VKVTDFGIAKLVDAEMTQSGTLLGTPSLHVARAGDGDKLDGRSDIFSLGRLRFRDALGRAALPGSNVTSILYKLVHVDPIEPANLEMHGLVPQKVARGVRQGAREEARRALPDATAFVQDLEYCLGSWFGSIGEQTIVSERTLSEASQPSPDELPTMVHAPSPPEAPVAPSRRCSRPRRRPFPPWTRPRRR